MREGKVAAIDLGKKRVGVAVSDELGLYAHPRPLLAGESRSALLEALRRLVADEGVTRFLVGHPVEMGGAEGPAARRARAFAQALANATGLDVELVDERLSTVEADRALRASGRSRRERAALIDGVAAAMILQSWLDARR